MPGTRPSSAYDQCLNENRPRLHVSPEPSPHKGEIRATHPPRSPRRAAGPAGERVCRHGHQGPAQGRPARRRGHQGRARHLPDRRVAASAAGKRSDTSGNFKISASGFSAPDCNIVVSDRQTPTATVKLAGCTPSTTPPRTTTPPPSGSCVIDAGAPATFHAGDNSVYNFTTTGCTGGPLQWRVVAGGIPTA